MSKNKKDVEYYQVKDCKLSGTSYTEVYKNAWQIYLTERKKSRRRPYVRSAYFKKDKIFIDIFWSHLKEKYYSERLRRIKFYFCALELLKKSKNSPMSMQDPNQPDNLLYRFYGETNERDKFIVQIKENKRSSKKYLISVFPSK